MSISQQLSYSLGLKDQSANKELASKLAMELNVDGVEELTSIIDSNAPRRLKMDATLTLAYIAEKVPNLLKLHIGFLIDNLSNQIDRVSWGSMISLSHLAEENRDFIYKNLPAILDAMDRGSVVCRDYGFKILVTLYTFNEYEEDVFFIILEQLNTAPPNQIGQYSERLIAVVRPNHVDDLINKMEMRRSELTNPHHLKRMDKNLKKLATRK